MSVELIMGNCLEKMKDMPDESVDLVLTDPPYGTTQNKWDTVIPFDKMWEQLERVAKPNSAICLFGSEPFSSALRMSNIKNYKYDWKWDKLKPCGHLNAHKRPMRKLEDICVFSIGKTPYYPQGLVYNPRIKKRAVNTEGSKCYGRSGNQNLAIWQGYPTEQLEFMNEYGMHPTQKPVALLEYLIRTYTDEGDTVLDFTMGSGSTGVACVLTDRSFIGIELDEKYFGIANQRIADAEIERKERLF
jgi:DNA modification methylase